MRSPTRRHESGRGKLWKVRTALEGASFHGANTNVIPTIVLCTTLLLIQGHWYWLNFIFCLNVHTTLFSSGIFLRPHEAVVDCCAS